MLIDKIKAFFAKSNKPQIDISKLFKMDFRISDEQIDNFKKKHGKQGVKILSSMGSTYHPFYVAIQSDIGQELLKDSLIRMEGLLDKIVNEEATKKDIADYRATKRIVQLWSKKIEAYTKIIQEIAKGV